MGEITGISKLGWEYLPAPRLRQAGMWARYADSEDAAAKAIVKKPVAVYIEQVYDYGDLSQLGIGA